MDVYMKKLDGYVESQKKLIGKMDAYMKKLDGYVDSQKKNGRKNG